MLSIKYYIQLNKLRFLFSDMVRQILSSHIDEIIDQFSDIGDTGIAIRDLIGGQGSPLSVSQYICDQVEKIQQQPDSVESYLSKVRSLIISMAVEVPFSQIFLVDLLAILNEWPGELLRTGIWGVFAMEEGDSHSSLAANSEEVAQYVNINSFEARLWQRLGRDIGFGLIGDPIRNLARSIEEQDPNGYFQTWDTELAAGCMWVIHAAPLIYSLCKSGDEDSDGKTWQGSLWASGRRGYSLERWSFWLERFQEISSREFPGVINETRRYAATACCTMRAVERMDH